MIEKCSVPGKWWIEERGSAQAQEEEDRRSGWVSEFSVLSEREVRYGRRIHG